MVWVIVVCCGWLEVHKDKDVHKDKVVVAVRTPGVAGAGRWSGSFRSCPPIGWPW